MFCLPRLPRTLLSSDKQLLLSIVDHQWAGHSGAGADFQTWRKTRSQGMMPARTVAAVVPALRRIIQVCGCARVCTCMCVLCECVCVCTCVCVCACTCVCVCVCTCVCVCACV